LGEPLRPTYVLLDGEESPEADAAAAVGADDEVDEDQLLERLKSEFDAKEVS
ncbi:MAG: hypothetical protein QOF23_843, partial [Solirubrobacterales bacterium]|nr:hypothetical protein [Solirubrobacterales bacterium]